MFKRQAVSGLWMFVFQHLRGPEKEAGKEGGEGAGLVSLALHITSIPLFSLGGF